MLGDDEFIKSKITPEVANITTEVRKMINKRTPINDIYQYILQHATTYESRYMCLFLFGLMFKWFKEDNITVTKNDA